MIDRVIYEDGSGGRQYFKNNSLQTTKTFYVEAYILLFGGNVEGNTSDDYDKGEIRKGWWGNDIEGEKSLWINSRTERALIGASISSSSLRDIKLAAEDDLKLMEKYGTVTVEVLVPSINRISINITIVQGDGTTDILFTWDAVKKEVIESIWL